VVCLVAIGVGGFLYFTRMEMRDGWRRMASASHHAAATPSPPSSGARFAAETVPFVNDHFRMFLAGEYATAADHKAVALNLNGIVGIISGQPSEEAAKNAALEQCQQRADAAQSPRKCEVYVVGNTVIYPHGRPPMPSLPWIRRDPSVEKPFAAKDMPLVRDPGKARLESIYAPGKKSKSIALGPGGQFIFYIGGETTGESVRRTLESCGAIANVACMIVAIDDTFVAPLPTAFKVTGFFQAAGNSSIAADAREDVARKLAGASSGWNAVAIGASGHPGLALKAANERNAVSESLGNCARLDSNCHIIAIGPFSVEPN
jgi:adenylate cyclase